MVFRSMVKDDTHFYEPLGLVSEGIKVDFQAGMNSYLYGTRFMSYWRIVTLPRRWSIGSPARREPASTTPESSSVHSAWTDMCFIAGPATNLRTRSNADLPLFSVGERRSAARICWV